MSREVDFTYDNVYNRTRWTDTSGSIDVSYSDNYLNQYIAVGGTTPTYDSRSNDTTGYNVSFDCENRLVTAGSISFAYDLLGRRIKWSLGLMLSIVYVWDGPQIIAKYDPVSGRFLQTDPAKYMDTMNLYAYCANNPVNWIDPWGLEGKECEGHHGFWEGVWTVLCHIHDVFIGGEVAPVITESTKAIDARSERNADMNVGFEMLGEEGLDNTWHKRNGKGGGYDKLPNDPLKPLDTNDV